VLDLGGCQLINAETGQKLIQGACTSGYCPPECEQPYSVLTPAADVYSVGSNLFHMLTGKNPLDLLGGGLASLQARSVRLETKFLNHQTHPALKKIIETCLDPDPQKRFATMSQLLSDLNALGNQSPVGW
jgi:serine/threonine protein kinase